MSDDPPKKLDRRSFFRMGARKAANKAVNLANQKARQRTRYFVRPPFAISELDFLLKCTRCNDCITACPHNTVFALSARLGVEVLATPALDLSNKACHLCQDWPCVTACQTRALAFPVQKTEQQDQQDKTARPAPPKLARAILDKTSCLPYMGPECGACGSVCPIPGAIEWDMTRPKINPALCVGCGLCRETCITSPKSIRIVAKTPADTS